MVPGKPHRILSLVNHDTQFELNRDVVGNDPFILNRVDLTESNYIETIATHVFSDGTGADFTARCQCGETEGNNKIGMTCPICKTEVSSINLLDSNNLVCKNWLSAPSQLPGGWLTPKIYLNLADWLSYEGKKRNYLDDILDVDAITPYDIIDEIPGKGFTYLYENFNRIIEFFAYKHPVISKKPETKAMLSCLALYQDRIFCHYVPILNAAITPIIKSEGAGASQNRYSDVTADFVLRAAISLSSLEFSSKKKARNIEYVERTAYMAYRDIIDYVEESTKKYIAVKKAIPRTHIFGNRCHFSFRGVVVPITRPHLPYEIHMPWAMAVNSLRPLIKGRLHRDYGLTINEVSLKFQRALQVIDPDIRKIMNDLIGESKYPGLPVVWDRPPSIRDGSVMLKYVTVIKDDIHDKSIGITPIDAALPNVDKSFKSFSYSTLH